MPPIRISLIILAMILADILSRPRILVPFTTLRPPHHMARIVPGGTVTNIHHNSMFSSHSFPTQRMCWLFHNKLLIEQVGNTPHSIPMGVITMLPVALLRTDRKAITMGIHRIPHLMLLLLVPRVTIEEIIGVAVFVADLLQVEVAIAAPALKALPGTLRPRHHLRHPLPPLEAMGFL